MSDVSCLLGRNYTVIGPVVYGNQIGGSVLNMPTANQVPGEGKILPPSGVYASRVRVGHKWYEGVSNIGKKPTIPGPNNLGIETFIYDFRENIYGEIIRVELLWFLRPEQKFDDMDALKNQMAQDKIKAKEVLASLKG
jgi:riboflavin kinase/FMN adenylyltransferase